MKLRQRLFIGLLASAGYILAQGAGSSLSDMLEDRMRGVVTVEVMDAAELPKGFFGAATTGGQVPPPKLNAYTNSLFLSRADQTGSGFVVRHGKELYVVTNAHVVEQAEDESIHIVSLTRKKYQMKLVGADTIRDIAVLKFAEPPGEEFKDLSFRTTPARIGERVYALGNPVGAFPSSVTDGIISGLNRQAESATTGYLQSSAMLSSGNSGGPLLDAAGMVVGVNTKAGQRAGTNQLNFALNSQLTATTVRDIIENGRVRRGSLGITIATLSLRGTSVYEIYRIAASVPANVRKQLEEARITHVNGIEPVHPIELFGILDQVKPGETVKLRLRSGDEAREVALVATELTDARLAEIVDPFLTEDLGVRSEVAGGSIRMQVATTKLCEPQFVQIGTAATGKSEPKEIKNPGQFVALAAGKLDENEPVLYPLSGSMRSLRLVVRRMAVEGQLALLSAAPDGDPQLAVLAPRLAIIPVGMILH